MEGHSFSTQLPTGEFGEWDIAPLFALKGTSVFWEIPGSFIEEWNWGDSHISEHLPRCVKAELQYPILILDGDIIDGCHRVCKALALGYTQIKAVDLTGVLPPPDRVYAHNPYPESSPSKWVYGDMVKLLKEIFRLGLF